MSQQNHGKNYHKMICPWHGVDLDNEEQCDQADAMPCICTDADFDAAILKDMSQHEREVTVDYMVDPAEYRGSDYGNE